jgi:hypothetical protein
MCLQDNYGIKAKTTKIQNKASHNPQANAIILRVHKVVNHMLRSFDLDNNHENLEKKKIIHLITSFNRMNGN